jgi:small subunit ribosomal protein S8
MSTQDTISDFVARVNNTIAVEKSQVVVIKSNFTITLAKWLTKYKFFESFEDYKDYYIKINLNLDQIASLKRVSKPGNRVYSKSNKYPKIVNGIGFTLISTSKGIFSNYELTKEQKNLGGEVILQVIKV